jgi:hypothetical protein
MHSDSRGLGEADHRKELAGHGLRWQAIGWAGITMDWAGHGLIRPWALPAMGCDVYGLGHPCSGPAMFCPAEGWAGHGVHWTWARPTIAWFGHGLLRLLAVLGLPFAGPARCWSVHGLGYPRLLPWP